MRQAARKPARRVREHLSVHGVVQGVGFRPHVHRLATRLGLAGWVRNTPEGVEIEVEGTPAAVTAFGERLRHEPPAHAAIQELTARAVAPAGQRAFVIHESPAAGAPSAAVLPDLATCPDCLAELFDAGDRRYRYPFTNCIHCGPRYTILEAIPYDRPNTAMRGFAMCPACRREYEDPLNRRFHAQPNACPHCGPQLAWWDTAGRPLARGDPALRAAERTIRGGGVVAVKGLGGFHLVTDAGNARAVERLRRLKRREEKPFAVMVPSPAWARRLCEMSAAEMARLASAEASIVLLRRRSGAAGVAPAVAPGNPWLGLMLPYTPLHHLLLADLGHPVVATSGNLAEEPICTDEREALERLGPMADGLLVHDRPIVRPVDDSVEMVVMGREVVLRRARGHAPLPVAVPVPARPVLAVGGHLKNTVALAPGRPRGAGDAWLSQHVGDLSTEPALEAFRRAGDALQRLYGVRPEAVACDTHPDYGSTRWAQAQGLPVLAVQHHHAHVLAVMAEHGLAGPVLGIAWDGTGHGPDGTVWGGEVLRVARDGYRRLAHLRRFPLPGGEHAVREPRRSALGLLHALYGEALWERAPRPGTLDEWSAAERRVLDGMLGRGVNAPLTSSAGRLFDAVAALLGLRQVSAYEGQAAMMVEWAAAGSHDAGAYELPLVGGSPVVLDWEPMVAALLADRAAGVPVADIAARFHNGLVGAMAAAARRFALRDVVLAGGCFQNRLLLERAIRRLRGAGFRPHWPRRVPPNDGGLALGQLLAARDRLAED